MHKIECARPRARVTQLHSLRSLGYIWFWFSPLCLRKKPRRITQRFDTLVVTPAICTHVCIVVLHMFHFHENFTLRLRGWISVPWASSQSVEVNGVSSVVSEVEFQHLFRPSGVVEFHGPQPHPWSPDYLPLQPGPIPTQRQVLHHPAERGSDGHPDTWHAAGATSPSQVLKLRFCCRWQMCD